jgi:hypothetical protein
MREEIEALGFTWNVDDRVDTAEIAEEQTALPLTKDQITLASFLEGTSPLDHSLVSLWRTEAERDTTPHALWRRYFRAGNPQMKKLILLGLDQDPSDRNLLAQLAFFHEFCAIPKELLARYMSACDREDDPHCFVALVRDFEEATSWFGYDALAALRERHAKDRSKMVLIEESLLQRSRLENEAVSFEG